MFLKIKKREETLGRLHPRDWADSKLSSYEALPALNFSVDLLE